jgi:hypothetical protein
VQTEAQYIFIYRAVLDALCDLLSIETDKAVAANAAKLASVGEESTRAAMLADDQALRSAADAAAEEKRVQEEAEKAHIEAARIELLARVETSASSAALVGVVIVVIVAVVVDNAVCARPLMTVCCRLWPRRSA